VTVVDSSAVVDLLVDVEAWDTLGTFIDSEGELAAPDVVVFEVLAVFRRHARRGAIRPERATGAIEDLGDLPLEIFPTLPLRGRAWELRDNFTAADALFVALAERLAEPLATKDRALAASARRHASIRVIELPTGS
jgi:predicted nucleic acid-binding protein